MEKIIRIKNLRKAFKKETAVENVYWISADVICVPAARFGF